MRQHPSSSRMVKTIHTTVFMPRSRPIPATQIPTPKIVRTDHRSIAEAVTEKVLSTRDTETGWITGLWEHAEKSRLYQVDLCQDLFGEWLLVDTWWRKATAFGGCKKTYLGFDISSEDARSLFYAAALRRSRHQYQPIDWRTFR